MSAAQHSIYVGEMNLDFDPDRAKFYKSTSQKIRIMSESWVSNRVYCPSCGQDSVRQYANNARVADFHCLQCKEEYELKSYRNKLSNKIVDGAYSSMMERLKSNNNPNLFLLHYDMATLFVINLQIITKCFFVAQVIEKRKPLSSFARRAGWIGCYILLGSIPILGKISLVQDRVVRPKSEVLASWQQTAFLREGLDEVKKGWLINIMTCIETLDKRKFSLSNIYMFEDRLSDIYPNNRHIREKIWQQLQVLRDNGYLSSVNRGSYELNIFQHRTNL